MTEKKIQEIEKKITDYRNGQMLIVTDDKDRENEGDLVISSEMISEEDISFMAKYGRGLICIAIENIRAEKLNLPYMTERNNSQYSTAFTVSVDAEKGTTTGISASDRLKTIKTIISNKSKPDDLLRPGHMFPLIAEKGGLLKRAGHTEAAIELSKFAGHKLSGVICEIMGDDGKMTSGSDLLKFAEDHNLQMLTIKDLVSYIIYKNSPKPTFFPTQYGEFNLYNFRSDESLNMPHIALVHKEINFSSSVTTRIHSECMTGDLFGSLRCDCGNQLKLALEIIEKEKGMLIYLRQEGRGIGFEKKMEAYRLQDNGLDTVEANIELGFRSDERNYSEAADMIKKIGITTIDLLTNNPEKIESIKKHGISVNKRMSLEIKSNSFNRKYLETKKEKMNHILNNIGS